METIDNQNKSPETPRPEDQLFQARVESATRIVNQAREELAKAKTEAEKTIWQNRLNQRLDELRRISQGEIFEVDIAA